MTDPAIGSGIGEITKCYMPIADFAPKSGSKFNAM